MPRIETDAAAELKEIADSLIEVLQELAIDFRKVGEACMPTTTQTLLPMPDAQYIVSEYKLAGVEMLIERVPAPNTRYAAEHQAGRVFKAGVNEWYCESGTRKDTELGAGYMVSRCRALNDLGVPYMRWFCTCIQAQKVRNSVSPYCKHMFAVQQHIRAQNDPLDSWTDMPFFSDIRKYIEAQQVFGTLTQEDANDILAVLYPGR